jgi:NitT/TauT family transport system permease protein
MPATEPAQKPPQERSSHDVADLEAGLDALSTEAAPRASIRLRLRQKALPPLVAIAVVLACWQIFVMLKIKPSYVVPGPLDVWDTLANEWSQGTPQEAVWTSLRRAFVGFAASIAVGTLIGLVVARIKPVRTAVGPVLTGLQSLPSVAWVPAAIIWFGLSEAAIYTVVLLGAVPSIANGLVAGVDQVPPLFLRVGKVLGARRLAAVRHVLLPAALPGYFAGLKQGWAFSWRSLMAAEIITTGGAIGFGLGSMLDQSRTLADLAGVLATILVILAIGILIELVFFAPLERRMLRRRGLLVERNR